MPKELTDFKKFVALAKRNDKDKTAKAEKRVVYIKNPKLGKTITKFKLRYSRYLYTFKTDKKDIAKRLKEAFASNKIESQEVKSKKVAKKKTSEKK